MGLHRSALAWADAGFDVILDGFLCYPEDDLFDQVLALLHPYEPLYVGVRASERTLRDHAVSRPGSDLDWALTQAADINRRLPVGVEIDTGSMSTAETIEAIVSRL